MFFHYLLIRRPKDPEETGSKGYEGSSEGCWEEFMARSDRSFEATRLAEAEGNGDVRTMVKVKR